MFKFFFTLVEPGSLSRQQIIRALIISVTGSCFAMVWVYLAQGMPLTMLMERLGATKTQIGLMVSLQQIVLILQLPVSILVERFKSKKPIWIIGAFIHRAIWILPGWIPFLVGDTQTAIYMIIAGVAISTTLAQMISPIWLSWMADLLPKDLSVRFWSLRNATITIASLGMVFVAGYILDLYPDKDDFNGFLIVYSIASLAGIMDVLIHLFVPEPKRIQPVTQFSLKKRFSAIFKNVDFMWLTAALCAWYFAAALVGVFGPLFFREDLELTYTGVSMYTIIASLGAFILSLMMSKLTKKYGARTLCVLLLFITPLLAYVFFFAKPGMMEISIPYFNKSVSVPASLPLVIIPQFIAGGFYSCIAIIQLHLAGILSKPRGRILALAIHWSLIGLIASAGSFAGGKIGDTFDKYFKDAISIELPHMQMVSYHILIIISTAIAWGAGLLMLKVRRNDDELTMAEVFRSMKIALPLRAITFVYQTMISMKINKNDTDNDTE